ncbi:MAG: hypothetical protein QM788_05645 [Roseateles sp.]|uniref:hypothetical protein n=1 Tax=Roseateles sp. TaxID=1971397 RepID=UPI0039EAD5AD
MAFVTAVLLAGAGAGYWFDDRLAVSAALIAPMFWLDSWIIDRSQRITPFNSWSWSFIGITSLCASIPAFLWTRTLLAPCFLASFGLAALVKAIDASFCKPKL